MNAAYACPAKINLTLEVLQRQPDGYHALRSLIVPLALHDTLQIESSERYSFWCNDDNLANEDNLVTRALRALALHLPPVNISLEKRIPVQAGLGGGSSDAAGLLRAAMQGAFGAVPSVDWIAVARALGSDVPFFLTETAALVEGTGERVTAIGELPPWHVLVVKPPVATSTAEAYARLAKQTRPSRPRNTSVTLQALDALQRASFKEVEALLSNDFSEIASAVPEIAGTIAALRAAGATNALLSGSGSAVFALAPEKSAVTEIAQRLDLPAEYHRYETAFAQTPAWRSARA